MSKPYAKLLRWPRPFVPIRPGRRGTVSPLQAAFFRAAVLGAIGLLLAVSGFWGLAVPDFPVALVLTDRAFAYFGGLPSAQYVHPLTFALECVPPVRVLRVRHEQPRGDVVGDEDVGEAVPECHLQGGDPLPAGPDNRDDFGAAAYHRG